MAEADKTNRQPAEHRALIDRLGLVTLLVIFVLAVSVLNSLPSVRIDLTENRLYTLSDGSREILADLDEPLQMYFYFSDKAAADVPALRNYADRVRDLLRELEQHSRGNLTVTVIDPLPFSEEEDQAAAYGLQAITLGGPDPVYFGLAGSNATDGREIISFIDPAKESFLEYDITSLIYRLSQKDSQTIGVLSSLPVSGGFDAATGQMREPWTIYSELERTFELRAVATGVTSIDADIATLLIIHPKQLSDATQYAIEQFLFRGGRALVFLDPFAETDTPSAGSQYPADTLSITRHSRLELLERWGISVPVDTIVADDRYALAISSPDGFRPMRHIGLLGLTAEALDSSDIATAGLDQINLGLAGSIIVADESVVSSTALLTSSNEADELPAASVVMLRNPDELRAGFAPDGSEFVLAARIQGQPVSAFPELAADNPEHIEQPERPVQLALVADTDLLADRYWAQTQDFFGQRVVSAFANNGDFVTNLLDNFAGSNALIGMRGRAAYSRPFTRVTELRRQAENNFRTTQEQLQLQLQQTEQRLAELQDNSGEISGEQRAELERFIEQRLLIRKRLRQVQRDLDSDIEQLGRWLKVINIGMMPLLIGLLGIALLLFKRQRGQRLQA